MNTLSAIQNIVQILGGTGTVVVLFILWKSGFLANFFNKKQTGGWQADKIRFDKIDQSLGLLTDNHLSHVQESLTKIQTSNERLVKVLESQSNMLREFKEYGIKIRP